jgi:hypothetical protein
MDNSAPISLLYTVFTALLATVLLEGLMMLMLFRNWRYFYYILLCNLLTNPAINIILYVVYYFFPSAYYSALISLEIIVVLIEARILKLLCGFTVKKSLLVSFVLNAFSYFVGLLLFPIF